MSGKLISARVPTRQVGRPRQLIAAGVLVMAMIASACSTSNVVETSVDASAAAGSESTTNTTNDQSSNGSDDASTGQPQPTRTPDTQPVSSTPAPAPTRPPARPTVAPSTGSGTSGGSGATVGIGTCPAEFVGAGNYIVTNIESNDPDGGLVGHTAPGVDAPATGVLPADFGVWVDGTAESCAVTENGAVWWAVHVGEGIYDWVNAYYLGYYEGPGNRPVVGGSLLCDSYQWLLDAQETDIPVTQALINIDVELGGHPTGVTNAIYNMVNGLSTDWNGDFATIDGYVGPICATSAVSPNPPTIDEPEISDPLPPQLITSDAEYWVAVELCWFDGDEWSCGQLENSGYTSDSNYGLGNSVSMTPWEYAVDNCARGDLDSNFYCREVWSRYETAINGDTKEYLNLCGQIAELALDPAKPIYHLDWALTFFSWDDNTYNSIAAIIEGRGDGNHYDVMQAGFVGQCEGYY